MILTMWKYSSDLANSHRRNNLAGPLCLLSVWLLLVSAVFGQQVAIEDLAGSLNPDALVNISNRYVIRDEGFGRYVVDPRVDTITVRGKLVAFAAADTYRKMPGFPAF
jgi:hypothetical protein